MRHDSYYSFDNKAKKSDLQVQKYGSVQKSVKRALFKNRNNTFMRIKKIKIFNILHYLYILYS